MPASKAQQRATNKYISKAYDRINVTTPKGKKETIQAHAAALGESVNGFINRAISETMERDAATSPQEAATAALGAGVVSLPSETEKRAPGASEGQTEGVDDGD